MQCLYNFSLLYSAGPNAFFIHIWVKDIKYAEIVYYFSIAAISGAAKRSADKSRRQGLLTLQALLK
jgi:hypothetical protein